jgi:hypothetical protein
MIKQIEVFSKRKWLLSGITLVGVLSATGAASAASLSTPSQTLTLPLQSTDASQTYTVNKFDPSLGTLNSVTVSLSGAVQGSASYTNNGTRQVRATLNLEDTADAIDPAGNTLAEVIPLSSQTVTVPAGGSGSTGNITSSAGPLTTVYTDTPTLAEFTGPGTANVSLTATGTSFAQAGGNFSSTFVTNASANASIFYTYTTPTSVPEPSNMLAVGLIGGLGVFTTIKKCQKRQAQVA